MSPYRDGPFFDPADDDHEQTRSYLHDAANTTPRLLVISAFGILGLGLLIALTILKYRNL